MNGEGYRASEWGTAQFRLASLSKDWANLVCWLPAVSVGDVGAATSVVQACVAIEAAQRGYAPTRFVALAASSDGPTRSCVTLSTESPLFV